jgi:hypothetical protein
MVGIAGQAGDGATAQSKAALSVVNAAKGLDTSNSSGCFNIFKELVLWDGSQSVKMLDTDAFWETYAPLFKETRSVEGKP